MAFGKAVAVSTQIQPMAAAGRGSARKGARLCVNSIRAAGIWPSIRARSSQSTPLPGISTGRSARPCPRDIGRDHAMPTRHQACDHADLAMRAGGAEDGRVRICMVSGLGEEKIRSEGRVFVGRMPQETCSGPSRSHDVFRRRAVAPKPGVRPLHLHKAPQAGKLAHGLSFMPAARQTSATPNPIRNEDIKGARGRWPSHYFFSSYPFSFPRLSPPQ
jgi:hypothetical protein